MSDARVLDGACLDRLYKVIESRRGADPETSHTAKLLQRGTKRIAQKVGEEAVEAVIEAIRGNRQKLTAESADLVYHILVMWADAGINPADVWAELSKREGVSGIAERRKREQKDDV
ncbi:MAG: phosphoribosyl-ATP diphosphatase [Alphaproteobacteria bacterium]|nr:phosphoribosyl-ATP diphosphatase [Alphaproteobacteria bacterium]